MKSIKHCVRNNWVLLTVLILALATAAFLYSQVSGEFQSTLNLGEKNSKLPFYGQLGDFFGGILNPAFGLITVCLLVWSIKIQVHELQASREELKLSRKEIVLSRVEMERSANALADQVRLNQNEYDRKQIEAAAEHYIRIIEAGLETKIEELDGDISSVRFGPNTFSINEAIQDLKYRSENSQKLKLRMLIEFQEERNESKKFPFIALSVHLVSSLHDLIGCIEELGEKYITSAVLGGYWANRAQRIVSDFHSLQLINNEMEQHYSNRISMALLKRKAQNHEKY